MADSDKLDEALARLARIEDALTAGHEPRLLPPEPQLPELIAQRFAGLPENALYVALFGGSEPLRVPGNLSLPSTVCRQIHFASDEYRHWMRAINRLPRLHRKDWEWFYIAQALFERGQLQHGRQGLGFAVGREPLPALFASLGCSVVATDQAHDQAMASGWATSGQYGSQLSELSFPAICPEKDFFERVSYRHLDMNDIPSDYEGQFDFCWSSCAFEHLGSIEHGLRFVERSLQTLRRNGVAVHTTEFNLSSNDVTIETPDVSIFRRRDIEELAERLERSGHHVEPFDWSLGSGFAEVVVDLPPYRQSPHLRLRFEGVDCTSLGLIVTAGK